LADTIDIHAGGRDLTFPHHENEIAQSEAATGKPFANYWMHNGYITTDNEKMSKSKDNFFTVRDILKDYDGEIIRFFLLSGHYRGPINFSRTLMEQAEAGLARIRNAKDTLEHLTERGGTGLTDAEKASLDDLPRYKQQFIDAMDDDLNTADAIAAIFELVSAINGEIRDGASKEYAKTALALLTELARVLGLLEKEDKPGGGDEDEALSALVEERRKAREAKDFARADEIRDILKGMGVTLKDTPQGVRIIKEN
jgi:cysteinyl-tRNA synthetase